MSDEDKEGRVYLGPFPDDRFLRDNDWRIKERPNGGQAVWVHVSGLELPERDAVARTIRKLRKEKGK